MKSLKLVFILMLTLMFFVITPKSNVEAASLVSDDTVTASYKDFTALPSDWSIVDGCDKNNTSVSFSNNEMVVTNKATTSNSLYYGSVYHIGTEKLWKDFTFEMTMKMTSAEDANRWFGIGYHTQDVAGNMVGYLMNYRNNGDSAFSAFNSSKSFFDGDRVNKQNVKLSDGQYHKIKIVMEGHTSKHYIDDKLIVEWDVRDRNTHLGGNSLNYGGFALFVNRSTVRIKDISIVGTLDVAQNVVKDEKIVSTYRPSANLLKFPTVVADVTAASILDGLHSLEVRPSNAILHVNDNLEVVVDGGTVVDGLKNVMNNNIKKDIIPVVYLENETQAQKFIEMSTKELVIDMAVMASDASLIKMVKDVFPVIRGIYHVKSYEKLIDVVHTANSNYAGVVALDQSLVSHDVVEYLHARFKTVWVLQEEETDFELHNSIVSGCYGMIVKDYANLYDLYQEYETNTQLRTSFNVAHRGLSSICNENSVHGTEKAIMTGATHVEVDAYLTKDNQVAIMHDGTIDRTSNGSGNVESYTLAELQQFQLDKFSPREKIPCLEDIIEVCKGTNVVLVIEVKSNKIKIVEVIAQKLKELDFMDQVVFISFNTGILGELKATLPEIPTANLNEARTSNMAAILYWMGTFNTGVDTHYTHISAADDKYVLKDRGIMGWYWTYDPISTANAAIKNGITGITNNHCNYFYEFAKKIEGVSFTLAAGANLQKQDFEVTVTYYDGFQETLSADLVWFEDEGDHYEVICSAGVFLAQDIFTMYTDKFIVNKTSLPDEPTQPDQPTQPEQPTPPVVNPQEPAEDNGCGGSVLASLVGLSLLSMATIVVRRKREE